MVVVQGQLFEASPAVVSVLIAALTGEVSEPARVWILELLFQIVSGESHAEAISRGNANLGELSRSKAREGLWIIYALMYGRTRDIARDILKIIESDKTRLLAFEYG